MHDLSLEDGHYIIIHLLMESMQKFEIYDRMGNELIYDFEPRKCKEVVTFVQCKPDPLWYGFRIMNKKNVDVMLDSLPNMKRTSSARREKHLMDELNKFMKDEAHASYDIFTGTREFTKVIK